MSKKLEKVFREARKMMEEMTPTHDKYKNMLVNMDLIKDQNLREGWEWLQHIGSMKDDLGRHVVPHCFHENFSGSFFKFLEIQQEHGHGVVPAEVEHKLLSKNKMGDNNYMINSSVTA